VAGCHLLPDAQTALTGHIPQRAIRAVQTRAPNSMIAWLKVQAGLPRLGTRAWAVFQIFRKPLDPKARGWKARRITRATLVSTVGVACSKAKQATAPAVYCPTPGSRLSDYRSSGTLPP
jgi:hypothetical protein